jgi:hypothetical protein
MGTRSRKETSEALGELVEAISSNRIASQEAMRVLRDFLSSFEGIVRAKLQSADRLRPQQGQTMGVPKRVKQQFGLADLS